MSVAGEWRVGIDHDVDAGGSRAGERSLEGGTNTARMFDMLGRVADVLERRDERGVTSLLLAPRPLANLEEP